MSSSTTRLPQYDAFIEKYGSDDFANESKEYMIITDTACEAADECILQEMDKHFIMACKYEGMLWDQAVSLMAWPDKHGSDESD